MANSEHNAVSISEISASMAAFDENERPPRADMGQLKRELTHVLATLVHDVPTGEYVYSHSLEVFFSPDGRPLEAEPTLRSGPVFAAYVRVSWVLPYATVTWRVSAKPKAWLPAFVYELPPSLRQQSTAMVTTLTKLGYKVLLGDILSDTLPGRFSELDDSPVSVYEALFSATD